MSEIPSGVPLGDIDPVKYTDGTPARDGVRETDVVLIELDALLDTRLGVLHQHHPDLAVKVLKTGKYRKRLIDRFGNITPTEFDELYSRRDMDTLKNSVLTNMPFFLQRLVKDCIVHTSVTNIEQQLCYMINVYPYKFEDESLIEMLKSCISYHMLDAVDIRIVSMAPEEITPQYLKENIDIIVMYRFQEWLYMHREEFLKFRCPAVTLVAPAIYWKELPDAETINECKAIGRDPISIGQDQLAEFITARFMDVSLFSIHEAINKETAANISLELQVQPEDIEKLAKERNAAIVDEPLKPIADYAPEDIL